MLLRWFVAGLTIASVSCGGKSDSVKNIADSYWEFYLRNNPEGATQLGEYKYNDKLSDYSIAGIATVRKDSRILLARLKALDASKLNAGDALDYALLKGSLEDGLKSLDLKMYEMPVDQFYGVHIAIPQIATYAPFDSAKHYEDYIARLHQVPDRLDQLTETMRQGMRDKLMPPRYLLEKTVLQCREIADAAGEKSPFSTPALHFSDGISSIDKKRLFDGIISAVDNDVRPAYKKLEKFIATEYATQGRTEEGYWSLPDGDARYKFNVHTQTTSSMTPEQIHQLGLAQVAEIEAQILALAKTAGYKDSKTFTKTVMADPNLKPKTREEILDNFRRYIGGMEPKLPQLFGRLPRGKLLVTSVPEYMEKDSSTQYIQGTPDGSRKGQVWVLTSDPTHHDALDDEATAYHEGVPGHHLQIAIQLELPLRNFHKALGYNAFAEGWALYAERLGKEVGFYQSAPSDLGRLRSELFRAIRLVVDTGVHYKHWKRQQMVDYFTEHFYDPNDIEVDRYIAIPGQALGYKIGQLKIVELRKRAQDKLGSAFDVKAFHDQVLGAGSVPLDLLESRIDTWIASVHK